MSRKLVLVGKSCSGKSTLADKFKELNLTTQLSTTSRPQRHYEKNNVDYRFISKEQFQDGIALGKFIEYDEFNGWYYGLTHEDYEKADILILTPRGLEKYLSRFDKKHFLIIYLESSTTIRKKRSEGRGDTHDDFKRRWVSDDIDFENVDQWGSWWDLKISIQDEYGIDVLENILKKIK